MVDTQPLVTVICVCYNHIRFVTEALDSTRNQTYRKVELIIIDDGSNDGSAGVINEWLKKNTDAKFLELRVNSGYCKAFNMALALANGKYIIDLAADDILLPNRIEKGVNALESAGEDFGVQFGDSIYIDERGDIIKKHSDRFPHNTIPQGNIYSDLISRYFISSPSMMIRKTVLDGMQGYDENLTYEDFDLWIRASRYYKFIYLPEVLVKKRVVQGSLSGKQFSKNKKHQESTFRVCKKIFGLNRSNKEKHALSGRILYELKWNLRFLNFNLVIKYLGLWLKNQLKTF